MTLTRITDNLNIHQSKADQVKGDPAATKAYFDSATNTLKIRINELMDEAEATFAQIADLQALSIGKFGVNFATEEMMASEMKKDIAGGVASYSSLTALENNVDTLSGAKADKTYVDSQISASQKVIINYSGTLAGLNLDVAADIDKNYLILDVSDVTNYGYVCYHNGTNFVQGWKAQEYGIANNSVTYNSLATELYETEENDVLKINNLPTSGTIAYAKFTFDCGGLSNDTITTLFDALTFDSNAVSCFSKIYQSNSVTTVTGATPVTGSAETLTLGTYTSYSDASATYDNTYQYVHILVGVNISVAQLTKYYLKNVMLKIGTEFVPLMTYRLYTANASATIEEVSAIDESFVSNVSEVDFSQLSSEVYANGSITRVYNKPQNGLIAYMKYTYDGDGFAALNMNAIFGMLTFDPNVVSCGAKVYLTNEADVITGGTSFQADTVPITGGKFVNYNKNAGNYNTTYRYIHVLIQSNISVSQLSKYYLANVNLKIGGVDVPVVSSRAYSAAEWDVFDVLCIDEKLIPKVGASKWYQKNITMFGDSITWYDGQTFPASHTENGQVCKGLPSYMRERMGCFVNNQALSGRNMVEMWNEKISTYDFASGIDAVTIMFGANDAREDIQPGTVLDIGSTFDTTTYAGAMQASIEKILGDNEEVKIYLLTPIRGWFNAHGTAEVPGPYDYANGETGVSRDYVDIMIEIGKLYGVPVLNWYDTLGLNDATIHTYLGDILALSYWLHPTNFGFEQMSNLLTPFLENN